MKPMRANYAKPLDILVTCGPSDHRFVHFRIKIAEHVSRQIPLPIGGWAPKLKLAKVGSLIVY